MGSRRSPLRADTRPAGRLRLDMLWSARWTPTYTYEVLELRSAVQKGEHQERGTHAAGCRAPAWVPPQDGVRAANRGDLAAERWACLHNAAVTRAGRARGGPRASRGRKRNVRDHTTWPLGRRRVVVRHRRSRGPTRDELTLKVALAVTSPGVDVADILRRQRTASLQLLQTLNQARAHAANDLAWSMVLDRLSFDAQAEAQWLDHLEATLRRAPISARTTAAGTTRARTVGTADQTTVGTTWGRPRDRTAAGGSRDVHRHYATGRRAWWQVAAGSSRPATAPRAHLGRSGDGGGRGPAGRRGVGRPDYRRPSCARRVLRRRLGSAPTESSSPIPCEEAPRTSLR